MTDPTHHQWQRIARSVSRKINLGWAMEYLSFPTVVVSILCAGSVVALRRFYEPYDHTLTLSIVIPALILIATLFALRSRKKHESIEDAYIRLESNMGLNSSLTAASQGKANWPTVPENLSAGVNWKYGRLCLPLLGSIALIIASFQVPVKAQETPPPANAPQVWDKLTSDIEELKEEELIQDPYIKELEEKLDELKKQPQKDWFSHPSLEATSNLHKAHQKELNKLSRNLDKAEKSLSTLKKYSSDLNHAQKNKLLEQYNNAMEAMEKGRMKPNKELLDQLKKVDPNMLNQLDPEQLKQLRDNMRNMSDELKKKLRDAQDQMDGNPNKGEGGENGEGEGEDGDRGDEPFSEGSGGIQRGPGHAPKVLGDEAEDLNPGNLEKLKPKNLKNALPGDLLETTQGGDHNVDTSKTKQQQGGDSKHQGSGGDSVWKGNYLPKEKRALKQFFEDKPGTSK